MSLVSLPIVCAHSTLGGVRHLLRSEWPTPPQNRKWNMEFHCLCPPICQKTLGEVKKKVTKPNGKEMGGSTRYDGTGVWESAKGEHWVEK